jgi:hypothetical protein
MNIVRVHSRWHHHPSLTPIDDKHILNKLQLLQNRVHRIERTLTRRDNRDRLVFMCLVAYFLGQTVLSIRRSIFN